MGDLTIGTKAVLSQSGSDEAVLSSTVTGGEGVGAVKVLYSNTVSAATTISIDGYFDDSTYGYYEAHFLDLQASAAAQGYIRLNTGGSADSSSVYWSALGENYTITGTGGVADRADQDGATFTNYDGTWNMARTSIDGTANLVLRFGSPQSTSIFKHIHMSNVSGGQNEAENYNFVDTGVCIFRSLTAVTGVTLYLSASGTINGKVLLYGYKK